jgi:nitroimidazol reductase NimA-like FMN-containing flavoprotein (pyridoxamine 5'-phosphate oxidase superfamily)
MRRPERELKDKETIRAILTQSQVGRIATVNSGGYPVIKPVNFLYRDDRIYIHSSLKGEKADDIRRGSPVCFEVDVPIAYVATRGPACKAAFYYRSVILKGKASLVGHREKKCEILEKMMEKYQPEGGFKEIQKEVLEKTAIIEISADEITAKENLGG